MPGSVFVDTAGWANLFVASESHHQVCLDQDIILHFRTDNEQPVSLIFNNLSHFIQPDEYGLRSFRLQAEQWPVPLRPIVWCILAAAPMNG